MSTEHDVLRVQRKHQSLLLSTLKRHLSDLNAKDEDEAAEMEVERNLLQGEKIAEEEEYKKVK